MHIRVSLLHGFTQVFNLLSGGLSRVFFFQDPYRLCGKLRAVFPDLTDQIMVGADGCLFSGKTMPQAFPCLAVDNTAIKAKHTMLRHVVYQILLHGQNSGLAHFHKFYTTIFQLCCRLHEIAAIGPQTGPVLCDQGNTRRTGKAGDVLSACKMLPHVLRLMEICCRHQIGIHMISLHQSAETRNSLCNFVHVIILTFHSDAWHPQ